MVEVAIPHADAEGQYLFIRLRHTITSRERYQPFHVRQGEAVNALVEQVHSKQIAAVLININITQAQTPNRMDYLGGNHSS